MTSHEPPDDDGFSLVELIFYVFILGLITTGIAVFFFNTWKAQASVSDQVDATSRGQVVSSQIEKAMRNAVAFQVTDASLAGALTNGPTLLVATGLTGSNACMGINMTSTGAAQIAMTSGGHLPALPWPTWQSGIVQSKVSGVSVPYFTQSGTSVSYSFDVKSTNGPTVHFQGTSYMRDPSGGTQSCF